MLLRKDLVSAYRGIGVSAIQLVLRRPADTPTRRYVLLLSALYCLLCLKSAHAITPEQDFAARCNAPGVIVCEGFDSASEFAPATYPNTGFYGSYIVQDTTTFASGGGSLHYPMTANGAPVQNDNWLQNFCSAHPPASCTPPSFTQNSDFYIQFRYRVDSGYLQNWETCCGSSPKIFDVANQNSSCGTTELTINNNGGTGRVMGYGNCGGYGLYVWPATGLFKGLSAPTYPYNYQSGYYNCEGTSGGDVPHPPGGCFTIPANVWMTFYEHVHIGTYNQSNSVFELWVSPAPGQPLQYLIKIPDFIMPTADTSGYNAIWFNVFMTGFSANNQAANVWLDEVIVSTQPIAAPGGTPSSPCDINGDGVVNVADVQLEVNMALGISPCTNASGTCTVVSVQRVVNAALGGTCVSP